MNDKRPVNLDLSTIRLPLPAKVSILHRVSGVFLFAAVAVLLCLLDSTLASEESFNQVKAWMNTPILKLVVWAVLAGLAYHTVAGIKHLVMDMGVGETLEGGMLGAKITLVFAAILIILAGVWVW